MRALVCKEIGSTDKLIIEKQPDPIAGPGERVTESWPLENFAKAFDSLNNRTARGKVILTLAE
jgi:hypothetical protein